AVLLFHVGYGLWAMSYYRPAADAVPVSIALVQPMAPHKIMNHERDLQVTIAQRLEDLSLQAAQPETPDLLLWPEGAGAFASRTPEFNPSYMRAVSNVQRATSATLIVHDIEFERDRDTGKLRYYSAISYIEPVARTTQSYHKN